MERREREREGGREGGRERERERERVRAQVDGERVSLRLIIVLHMSIVKYLLLCKMYMYMCVMYIDSESLIHCSVQQLSYESCLLW